MKNLFKKASVLLLAVVFCINLLYINSDIADAATKSKYLVLIEQKNGTWKSYTNLIEKSENGKLMIKASLGAKALGFTYKNYEKTFTIKIGNKQNTYTKESKIYTYKAGTKSTKKTAPNIAYTSKTSKSNVVSVGTLATLLNYKYFGNADSKKYGYTGIVVYSSYSKISTDIPTSTETAKAISEPTKAPSATPTKKPEPTKEPTATPTREPTPTPTKKPSNTTSIEGVKFPVKDSFLNPSDAGSDWGGAGNTLDKFKGVIDGKTSDISALMVTSNVISYSNITADASAVTLTKSGNSYKLTISAKLNGSETANVNAKVVKSFCYVISSTPQTLYNDIYTDFTDTYVFTEDKYVKSGDCLVKVSVSKGEVVYEIKSAN